MGAFKPCYWCGNQFPHHAMTRDHLIPAWALRLFPELRHTPANIAKACAKDNVRKGGMPPALYAEVRLNRERRNIECRRWGQLQQQLAVSSFRSDDMIKLRAYVLEEMRRPYTPPFYEAEEDSDLNKLDRIRRLLDKRPEKIKCEVSAGKVDGLARWEKLNPLIHDRPPTITDWNVNAYRIVNPPHSKNKPIKRLYDIRLANPPESPRKKRALVEPSLEDFVGGKPTRTGEAGG